MPFDKEKRAFERGGGLLRTSAALRVGVHPRVLYQMRDQGIVERLSRGLYRLADLPPLSSPDLAMVAATVPSGVICLISALAYHEITTQIPHEVHVALPRGAEPSRLRHPPLHVFWFTGKAFSEGIEAHGVDGIRLRVYSPEKTLADCFKYRNKLGLDVFLEALKLYLSRKRPRIDQLTKFAVICRVERLMRPYLEALLYSP
ncbi:MAG: type IV toxin-antitoxin system AbiEi family antitoxin domain-containing protein [Candidatus Binatus sp.]|uniref:type IV toxin-antitoxin system AbiEi family antitoxin domain-containing protein n=1 Tax=Candidatus Binatus sp. TaxID=2811406 RepID=UPI003C7621BD